MDTNSGKVVAAILKEYIKDIKIELEEEETLSSKTKDQLIGIVGGFGWALELLTNVEVYERAKNFDLPYSVLRDL